MKMHPVKSVIIRKETEKYKDLVYIVKSHHEHWDGKDYPKGLASINVKETVS